MAEEWLEEEPGDEEAWKAALAAANARAQAESVQPGAISDAQDDEARERAKKLARRERARRALASFDSAPVERFDLDELAPASAAPVAPAVDSAPPEALY